MPLQPSSHFYILLKITSAEIIRLISPNSVINKTIFNSETRFCKNCDEISYLSKKIPTIENSFSQVMSPETAYQITSMLEGVVQRGTGKGLRDLNLEAKKRYFNLQKANEEIEVAKKSIESSSIGLRDAKIRFESGIGTKLEVLEAKTQLARDQQLLNIKVGDQKIGQRSLAEILNFPEDVTPLIGSKTQVTGIWDLSLEDSIIAAYDAREELDSILLDISINNSNANAALASSQPKVSIVNTTTSSFYQGELNQSSPNMNTESSSLSNTIGLNATWFIFDGGNSRSLYNYNKSKAKEAKLNFASSRAQIRKEVETVFFKLESAKLNISASYAEVLSARESLRLAKLRYKSGITTQREVVNNQRDLTDSEVRYIISVTSYNTLLADLSRQTGLDNIKPCDIKVNQQNQSDIDSKSLYESNLIPLCQL